MSAPFVEETVFTPIVYWGIFVKKSESWNCVGLCSVPSALSTFVLESFCFHYYGSVVKVEIRHVNMTLPSSLPMILIEFIV